MDSRNDTKGSGETSAWNVHQCKVCWGAIWGGTFLGIGIMILLTLLGLAIGLTTIDPYGEQNPRGLAIGQAVWWVISGIISLFLAGWVTGYLNKGFSHMSSMVSALVTWGLINLAILFLATTTAGAIVGGGLGLLQSGISAAGQGAVALLNQTGMGDSLTNALNEKMTEQDKQQLNSIVMRTIKQGKLTEQDKQTLKNMLATKGNMSTQQADSLINNWSQRLETAGKEASEQAKQAAEAASNAAAGIAWAMFLVLLLEGAAAAVGGWVGGSTKI
jgi:hypothetical protein